MLDNTNTSAMLHLSAPCIPGRKEVAPMVTTYTHLTASRCLSLA
jgi:hypothetical protein